MDLFNKLQELQRKLDYSVKELRHTSNDYATAYTEYRVALAQELVKLRDNNIPVTICSDLARGNRDVAKKKFDEIATEGIYKANLEAVNSLKLQIRLVEAQLQREWTNTTNN